MAKKLSADLAANLNKLGIKAKTEEEAHEKLIAILEKNGIEGMEDESLTALIDMADAFLNDSEDEEEEVEETEDDEVDDTEEEEDDETDSEEVEADDDEAMDELADEVEADDAEAEEAKKEEKKEEKKAKKAEKPEKKAEKKTTEKKQRKSKNGVKLNPKTNVEDREALATLREIFPEKDYEFNWIEGGVTIKHIGKNSKRAVLSVYDLARKDDGTVIFTLLFNTMTKEVEKLEELGLEYSVSNWTKQPFIKNVTPEYAKEVIGMLLETILGFVGKLDKRLGENRKKMEENLKKNEKKSTQDVDDEEPKTKKVTKKSKK